MNTVTFNDSFTEDLKTAARERKWLPPEMKSWAESPLFHHVTNHDHVDKINNDSNDEGLPPLPFDIFRLHHTSISQKNQPIVFKAIILRIDEGNIGAISIEHMVYRLACYNGMIMPSAVRRNHVGRRNDVFAELDSAAEFFSDKTRELDDKAFFAKVSDVVDAVFNLEGFTSIVDKFARAKAQALPEDVTEVIEIVTDRFRLNEGEGKSVLKHLAAGGDLSLFGLVNAVTRTAEDVESYDRAIEFERMGGEVLELPQTVWGKN